MQTLCESCSKPQPADWRAGDLCVWCGQASRREVRCFWCAKWTPEAKFCRTCGAAIVEGRYYGAARMLKDAGSDRFTIPRQVAEFDPEQIENFTRIFQEQASVAESHIAQVEFLEQFLEQKHWSAALDEHLAPQLPWPLESFEAMRAAARSVPAQGGDVARVRSICESTPFPSTRTLANIARVALDDWSALDEVSYLLDDPDQGVRSEAVLALSNWRVLYGAGLPCGRDRIIQDLKACPLTEAASIRLALLGEPPPLPLPPGEFATALVEGDSDFLAAAAAQPGDSLRQYAAARKLAELDQLGPIALALTSITDDQKIDLLKLMDRRRKPVPELRDALFSLAGQTQDRDVRRFACNVLCYGCTAGEVLKVARLVQGDSRVYQALLQAAGLAPDSYDDLGAFLLETNTFRMSQFGLSDAAKRGRMPAAFVVRHWADADSPTRVELCKFAEAQLMDYGDDALHHFLVGIAFTPGDVKVQNEAWSCLYRWYDSFGFPRRRPLTIGEESIAAFFGTPRLFLDRFTEFFEVRDFLRESLHRDHLAELLRYPDASALPLIARQPREVQGLSDALAAVMRDSTIDFTLRLACTDFLGFLRTERTLRPSIVDLFTSFASTDFDLQSTRALDRIEASKAGDPVSGDDEEEYDENGEEEDDDEDDGEDEDDR